MNDGKTTYRQESQESQEGQSSRLFTLLDQQIPIQQYEGGRYEVKVFGNFTQLKNQDGTSSVLEDSRLLMKRGEFIPVSAEMDYLNGRVDQVLVDSINGGSGSTRYLSVLEKNQRVEDYYEEIQWPEELSNAGIQEISSTLDTNDTVLMVRYTDNTVAAFNYVTGNLLFKDETEKETLSFKDYIGNWFTETWSNLWGPDTVKYDEIKVMEQELKKKPLNALLKGTEAGNGENFSSGDNVMGNVNAHSTGKTETGADQTMAGASALENYRRPGEAGKYGAAGGQNPAAAGTVSGTVPGGTIGTITGESGGQGADSSQGGATGQSTAAGQRAGGAGQGMGSVGEGAGSSQGVGTSSAAGTAGKDGAGAEEFVGASGTDGATGAGGMTGADGVTGTGASSGAKGVSGVGVSSGAEGVSGDGVPSGVEGMSGDGASGADGAPGDGVMGAGDESEAGADGFPGAGEDADSRRAEDGSEADQESAEDESSDGELSEDGAAGEGEEAEKTGAESGDGREGESSQENGEGDGEESSQSTAAALGGDLGGDTGAGGAGTESATGAGAPGTSDGGDAGVGGAEYAQAAGTGKGSIPQVSLTPYVPVYDPETGTYQLYDTKEYFNQNYTAEPLMSVTQKLENVGITGTGSSRGFFGNQTGVAGYVVTVTGALLAALLLLRCAVNRIVKR